MMKVLSRVGCFALLGLLAVTLFSGTGCTRRADNPIEERVEKPVEDPWPKLVNGLRRETDPQTCRRLLSQLSADISTSGVADFQSDGLAAADEPKYKSLLGLSDDQISELRPSSYASLDGQYLSESFYLRDVARALDVEGLPPERKAELAFAWVCRQVVLSPGMRATPNGGSAPMPPFPPTFALRRGSGSGLERAYIMIALMQQFGLDSCLIGPAAAADRPWFYVPIGSRTDQPKGPFWAVAVRIGSELHLFDPWRGAAFPGTLRQLQADPNLLKPWIDDKTNPWDGSPALLQEAVPILAYPINSFAPRMKRLELELRNAGGIRLSHEPQTLLERFQKETKLDSARFWTVANDPYSLPRVLSGFLPREEGGNATDITLYGNYLYGSLPADLLLMLRTRQVPTQYERIMAPFLPSRTDPSGLPEAIERIADISLNEFRKSFLLNPLPRELIQRGQFFEVAPMLTNTRERYIQAQNRIRTDKGREEELAKWSEKARTLFLALSQARSSNDAVELASVSQKLETHWRDGTNVISAVIDLLTAETCLAEATYLLAVSTHEQAERAYARYLRAKADSKSAAVMRKAQVSAYDACEESVGWWDKYKPFATGQNSRFPRREAHANELASRMIKLAAELKP